MYQAHNSQSIYYDDEAIDQLITFLNKSWSKVFLLVDGNTRKFCLTPLLQQLPKLGEREILQVKEGESSKSPEVLAQLWLAMSKSGADRHSLLVNVGGGMVSDLGGMLAGTYMRGIGFVNFPTSLLAMVDASVGGKNSINLNGIKNQIGLFIEPKFTGIIPDFLETLPQRELYSGFAEMLKHGLIKDEAYLQELLIYDLNEQLPTKEQIRKSVEIKREVVEFDFKENDLRKVLNFGHTIGHALETASMREGKLLLHGEAVILGMIAELYLSEKYLGMEEKQSREIIGQLRNIYPKVKMEGKPKHILLTIKKDKKNFKGVLHFSLIEKPGKAKHDIKVSEKDVLEALNYLVSL